MLFAFYLSLFQVTGTGGQPKFIGITNYLDLLHDDLFIKSLLNTSYFALGSIFIITPAALLLALLLYSRWLKGREFFRLLFFSPNITSGVVVAIIFSLVFNEKYGLLNYYVLQPLGIPPVRWLLDSNFVMPSILILGLWRWTGINALYFMAGLQNISPEIQEAALIDGANSRQAFRYITLPLLRPTLVFVLTFAIIGSYNVFTEPSLLTNAEGGPNGAGLFITMYLFLSGFRFLKSGYAAAIGYALALIILLLTLIQLRITGLFRED